MRGVTTVVGATGLLGSMICRCLARTGEPVRALTRPTSDPARVAWLWQEGVALAEGDLKDPPSLRAACEGARAVISTASSTLSRQPGDSIQTVDQEGQLALVDAARAAGVSHFVFVSFVRHPEDFPLQRAKRAVEARLKRGGMPFTILQPTFFNEVWLSPALGFDFRNARARILGAGDREVCWISAEEVARFAVGALDASGARNATLVLGGEEALSQLEVVHRFEERGGRKFELEHVSEQVLRARVEAATNPLERSFAALMLNLALGCRVESGPARRIIQVQSGGLREYIDRCGRAPDETTQREAEYG